VFCFDCSPINLGHAPDALVHFWADQDFSPGGSRAITRRLVYHISDHGELHPNLVRPNSHKENLSPWQIIERLAPRSHLELCLLPPIFLDYYLTDSGGYDVGRLPYTRSV
jgi:hypothetical protein